MTTAASPPSSRPAPSSRPLTPGGLALRLITAAALAPLVLLLLYHGPAWGFYALVAAATAVAAWELYRMTHARDGVAQAVLVAASVATSAVLWWAGGDARAVGTLFVTLPIVAVLLSLWRLGDVDTAMLRMATAVFGPLWIGLLTLLALLRRDMGPSGPGWVVMALMFAWFGDTGGYFAGRFLGRRRLYPAVSPKKTVEGLAGALAGAVLGGLWAHFGYLPEVGVGEAVGLGFAAGLVGQLGDLGESLVKRSMRVKDSGGILPGHGGMLDRIDALLLAGAVVWLWARWR